MFKIFKSILNTPTEASKVADAVIKGTDAAWFTKEEQSEWFLRYLESTQPMNLSRRIIAIAATGIWSISAVVLLSLILLGSTETAKAVFDFMNTVINPVFMLIIGFYFAKNIASSFRK